MSYEKEGYEKHERSEKKVEKVLGLKREPEVGIFEKTTTEELRKIMREN